MTAPATATAADRARLRGDLVPLPGQAQPWQSNSQDGPTGVLTLAQFAQRLADTAVDTQRVTDEETDRGFQYAVREDWTGSDGSQADVYLVQFSSAGGAQSYVLACQDGNANTVGTSGTYQVPGAGDAMAYQRSGIDSQGNVYTEGYLVVGNVGVWVNFWTPAKADRAAVLALLKQQYAALLADPTVAAAQRTAPALPTPGS
ncbi:hypothetical protein GXW82_16455 [Streptacidiphilus sp. 4-A2]|nr:hypothetical protein [Streptacidiphilus sp. 4-A2]